MVVSILIGLLCGLGVGMNFKVLALVPAHAAALALAGVMVAVVPMSVQHVGTNLLCWSLALQVGYVIAISVQRFAGSDMRTQPASGSGKREPRGR